eukprot:119816-Rhodomonas_salina.1
MSGDGSPRTDPGVLSEEHFPVLNSGNSSTPVASEVTPGIPPESSPRVENLTPLEDGPQQSVAGQNLYASGQTPEMAIASPEDEWEKTMPTDAGTAPSQESAEAQERRGGKCNPESPQEEEEH